MQAQAEQLAAAAAQALNTGNVPLAEIFARLALQTSRACAPAHDVIGRIALGLGEARVAAASFRTVLALSPGWPGAAANLDAALRLPAAAEGSDAWRRAALAGGGEGGGKPRGFLLAKAWGYGFWSDVNQTLGQLLLAEITGRVPVIHWGSNSRFGAPGKDDAWTLYFEAPSDRGMEALLREGFRYFPAKWSRQNLRENELNKWHGPDSRMAGLLFLNRPEEVVVCDFHTSVAGLCPWLPPEHPMSGRPVQQVYRYLAAKYLRPLPDIRAEIDEFYSRNMAGKRLLGAHVRGSDKVAEVANLHELNARYAPIIQAALQADPAEHLFLLTDSQPTLEQYRSRYGARVIHTECRRSSSQVGVHYDAGLPSDRRRIGVEVIKDTYLAVRCDRFLGQGQSAVSCFVGHLREWPEGAFNLLGDNRHLGLMPGVYMR